jgi:hypothetical protein
MATLQMQKYHACGKRLLTKTIHVSVEGFDDPAYPIDFCPGCHAYIYYHGERGREGVESQNPHDVESYVSGLILEGRKAKAAPNL